MRPPPPQTQFRELLRLLSQAGVESILVGGVAAFAHGSGRVTVDLDIVYRRTPENIQRIIDCLAPYHPYLRGAPPGLPFQWDVRTITQGLNFTLETSLGWIDLLGEITGGGTYENLVQHANRADVHGSTCLCLGLDQLIHAKRAAGRPKDFEAVAELETIREERDQQANQ